MEVSYLDLIYIEIMVAPTMADHAPTVIFCEIFLTSIVGHLQQIARDFEIIRDEVTKSRQAICFVPKKES